ncbi:hypothetical protein K461DRAFT_223653 [Myriangium duriaei CBS 260.36]|uniref:Impact N-terminal domain-containing protein n=1 Tax=Myriangium duriaei CBS 260.36 TaxID=1168546 RepID=A0A9P4J1I2_9PEZI|nr:hypothetical protein K461DRAFT_223653 [Myriangium duriaei CBS 260.36]
MSTSGLQALLRFLTKDAKVSLATAMGKVKELQQDGLDSPELISKSDISSLTKIFSDEKAAKAVLNAARRISKKRGAGQMDPVLPAKRSRRDPFEVPGSVPPAEVEESLALHSSHLPVDELERLTFTTNRAPLVLAFAATLIKYTMPEQPPSSRLSLAQAVVSLGSQSKAKAIGLSTSATAEDEGWGQGQPVVKVMNREISILKRWGYEWRSKSSPSSSAKGSSEKPFNGPALWAIDLEQLKTLNGPLTFSAASTAETAGLPVYSPQAARRYLYGSFDSVKTDDIDTKASPKKKTAAISAAERESNVGALLQSLDLLYESWADTLTAEELDKRSWSWYVTVRPEVEYGVAGWGKKGPIKLKDILDLRRKG